MERGVRSLPQIPTNVGGLRSIELNFRPMRDISTGATVCYLSRTHLNTPGLGVLMPETFRPVAEISGLSEELFELELLQLAEAAKAIKESGRAFNWISLKIPVSVVCDKETADRVGDICERFKLTPNELAFTVPKLILTEKDKTIEEGIVHMRRNGYHIILSDFGDNDCPFLRLADVSVDYVMISSNVTSRLGKSDKADHAVASVVSYIKGLDIEPIADAVKTSTQAEKLYEYGCSYCVGSLSGKYVPLTKLIGVPVK